MIRVTFIISNVILLSTAQEWRLNLNQNGKIAVDNSRYKTSTVTLSCFFFFFF
jgi:hypothetical protein